MLEELYHPHDLSEHEAEGKLFLESLTVSNTSFGELKPTEMFSPDVLSEKPVRLIMEQGPPLAGKSTVARYLVEKSETIGRKAIYVPFEGAQQLTYTLGSVVFKGQAGGHSPQEYKRQTAVFELGIYLAMANAQRMLNDDPTLPGIDIIGESPGEVGRGTQALINISRIVGPPWTVDWVLLLPGKEIFEQGFRIRSSYGPDKESRIAALEKHPTATISDENIHIGGAGLMALLAYFNQEDEFLSQLHTLPFQIPPFFAHMTPEILKALPHVKFRFMEECFAPYWFETVLGVDASHVGIWRNVKVVPLDLGHDPLAAHNLFSQPETFEQIKAVLDQNSD